MLMRSFTRREKIMLLVLVLIMLVGLYVLFVHNPVQKSLADLDQEKENLELQRDVAQAMAIKYTSMKNELEEIFQLPKDQITVMPLYDNAEVLMIQLNHILGELEYNLNFSTVTFADKVATRAVQVTFDAPSYEEARDIIQRLTHTGNRSLMNTLAITPVSITTGSGGTGNIYLRSGNRQTTKSNSILSGPQQVTGTITFYESAPDVSES